MRYLTVGEVLDIHSALIELSGGAQGVGDLNGVESALAQPRATFDGAELYLSLAEKAAALGYSLINNHPFIDGNKRIGHAAMEVFLVLNGYELAADIDDAEQLILGVAAGRTSRLELVEWIDTHLVEKS